MQHLFLLILLLPCCQLHAISHRMSSSPKESQKINKQNNKPILKQEKIVEVPQFQSLANNYLPYGVFKKNNFAQLNYYDKPDVNSKKEKLVPQYPYGVYKQNTFIANKYFNQPGVSINDDKLVPEIPYNYTLINNRTQDDKMYVDQLPDPEQVWADEQIKGNKSQTEFEQVSNMIQFPKHATPKSKVDGWQINTMYADARPTDDFYSSFPNWTPFIVQDIYKEFNDIGYLSKLTRKYPVKKKVSEEKEDDITLKQMQINVKQERNIYQKDVM